MGSMRALFASLGASAAVLAAAALALLVVSALLAAGSGAGDLRPAGAWPALILGGAADSDPDISAYGFERSAATPLVLRATARRERPKRLRTGPAIVAAPVPIPHATLRPIVRRPPATVAVPLQPPAPPAVTSRRRSGDAVRHVGIDLSSTVRTTGTALADAATPLGPPVSQALQDVLDGLATVLERTTDGIGAVLDRIQPPEK